jgi:hypothetical protein
MGIGSLVGAGYVRISADTSPAEKAIKGFAGVGSLALQSAFVPITGAVIAGVGAMSASIAAAGAGIGVFAAAVKPQWKTITDASKVYSQAQASQDKATLATARAQDLAKQMGVKYGTTIKITSKMSTEAKVKAQDYNRALAAQKTATLTAQKGMAAYKMDLGAMPSATRATADAFQQLKDDIKAWSDNLAPATMPLFTTGLKTMSALLPKLSPLVKTTAGELQHFMGTFGTGTAGRVFREFGDNVNRNAGGALRNFLDIARNVIVGFTGILNAFMPVSNKVSGGLADLTAKFANWGANLGKSKGFATFMDSIKSSAPQLGQAFKQIMEAIGAIVTSFGPLAGAGTKVIMIFGAIINAIPTPILKQLVNVMVVVNLAMKLWAVYSAAASAATWLFSTSITTNSGTIYANRVAMVLARIGMVLHALATAAVTAATWLWSAATTAATFVMGLFRLAGLRSIAMMVLSRAAMIAMRIGMIAMRIATLAWAAATWLLAGAMAVVTSPITLIILGIALLVAAILWVALKTTWFQTAWKYTWNAIKAATSAVVKALSAAFKWVIDFIVSKWKWLILIIGPVGWLISLVANWDKIWGGLKKAFWVVLRYLVDKFLWMGGQIIHAAANMLGWVPGVGGKLKKAAKEFDKFRANVNKSLGDVSGKEVKVPVSFRTVGGQKIFTRAAGGAIDGPSALGNGTSDSNFALLSKGEHVWTAKEVSAAGGHGAMHSLRRKVLDRKLPAFKNGGHLGGINVATKTPSYALIKSLMQKAINAETLANKRALFNALPLGASENVSKALAWARTQNGKRYQWGGNGNPSWDCSGFLSAIESVIRGQSPHRRWATGSFPPGAPGWKRNLNSNFMIGITNAGVGHTAGTLGGVNVESRGGAGVIVGPAARGWRDSLFTSRWGLDKAVGGGQVRGSAQSIAQSMLGDYGWGQGQFSPLQSLWDRESGWRWNALNRASGAYGIPQALPASKMASAGPNWRTDARTQIKWGLGYIKSRYGSPGKANNFQASHNWYDTGGWLPPGLSLAMNGTGKPERIRTASQEAALTSGQSGEIHVHFHGPVGSQRELETWLVTSLDNIGRGHRVPASFKRNG